MRGDVGEKQVPPRICEAELEQQTSIHDIIIQQGREKSQLTLTLYPLLKQVGNLDSAVHCFASPVHKMSKHQRQKLWAFEEKIIKICCFKKCGTSQEENAASLLMFRNKRTDNKESNESFGICWLVLVTMEKCVWDDNAMLMKAQWIQPSETT